MPDLLSEERRAAAGEADRALRMRLAHPAYALTRVERALADLGSG